MRRAWAVPPRAGAAEEPDGLRGPGPGPGQGDTGPWDASPVRSPDYARGDDDPWVTSPGAGEDNGRSGASLTDRGDPFGGNDAMDLDAELAVGNTEQGSTRRTEGMVKDDGVDTVVETGARPGLGPGKPESRGGGLSSTPGSLVYSASGPCLGSDAVRDGHRAGEKARWAHSTRNDVQGEDQGGQDLGRDRSSRHGSYSYLVGTLGPDDDLDQDVDLERDVLDLYKELDDLRKWTFGAGDGVGAAARSASAGRAGRGKEGTETLRGATATGRDASNGGKPGARQEEAQPFRAAPAVGFGRTARFRDQRPQDASVRARGRSADRVGKRDQDQGRDGRWGRGQEGEREGDSGDGGGSRTLAGQGLQVRLSPVHAPY